MEYRPVDVPIGCANAVPIFKVRNVTGTFRAMNEAVMRQVVGDRTVTEVLTVGRQAIETRVEELLRALTQQYEMGITIEQVVLQDVNPPDPVKPSWDEVNQAQQQRDRMINEARAEYNKVIPRAKGEAQQAVLEAEGYGLNRVNRAQGESARFQSIQQAYRRAPDVTRRRLHLETMERVLPRMGGKVFLDAHARRAQRRPGASTRSEPTACLNTWRWPMTPRMMTLLAVVLAGVVVAAASAFRVGESDQVIITQFGDPVGDPISVPGLHLKVPFIQQANYFDKRFLEWDGSPTQVPTKDKRFIWVDTYARWRIVDPLRFFQRLRDERGAQSRSTTSSTEKRETPSPVMT